MNIIGSWTYFCLRILRGASQLHDDLNGDGTVNVLDLIFVANTFK